MSINIAKQTTVKENEALLVLTDASGKLKEFQLTDGELEYIKKALENKEKLMIRMKMSQPLIVKSF